jgi:hypothetical protein
MQPSPNDHKAETSAQAPTLSENHVRPDDGLDLELLSESLTKTPWERMLANDDALRFADSLRAAMEKRNAEPQRIDAPPR